VETAILAAGGRHQAGHYTNTKVELRPTPLFVMIFLTFKDGAGTVELFDKNKSDHSMFCRSVFFM